MDVPNKRAPGAILVGYDGWYEQEVLVAFGLGLPHDFLAGRAQHVLTTLAYLFLNPNFLDEFSQSMSWLAMLGTYNQLPVDCVDNCVSALTVVDSKMQSLLGLTTPFAHRNMVRFVEYAKSHAPKPGGAPKNKRLDFSQLQTYEGDMSLVLPAIAFEHTCLCPRQVNFYDRAVARLALWACGAQVLLSREEYVELFMTVENPHQGWRLPDLNNPHVAMALYVLEHARLRARVAGLMEHKS